MPRRHQMRKATVKLCGYARSIFKPALNPIVHFPPTMHSIGREGGDLSQIRERPSSMEEKTRDWNTRTQTKSVCSITMEYAQI